MQHVINVLEPIFQEHGCRVKSAPEESLTIFKLRAHGHGVPDEVTKQLTSFYLQVAEVPCLDSFVVHGCNEIIIFEWWQDGELWLGTRDYYILRWSSEKARFCIGDANNVSFSNEEEFIMFSDAVVALANVYS